MPLPLDQIQLAAAHIYPPTIEFAQQLISIPSMSGAEATIAQAISQKMSALGYDEVWAAPAGNIIGKINGGDGPAVILNGHMDHVDIGPAENWPYPPFSGQIVGNELWGRGAVDMKSQVACMIHAAAIFKQLGLTPPGNVYVTIAVMEELGGLGTQYLTSHLKAQAAICGEPSHNVYGAAIGGEWSYRPDSAANRFTPACLIWASIPIMGRRPLFRLWPACRWSVMPPWGPQP
jgi:acetylornithine deacetylase/succinyl-diaminopimelate desuccinylase-like protein